MKVAAKPNLKPTATKTKPKDHAVPAARVLEIISTGEGRLLGDEVRRDYERKLGHSLKDVRIYDGADTAAAIDSMRVEAVTVNQDIYFGRGKFRPETTEGRLLLAHELTHAIQQQGGSRSETKSAPTPEKFETEARSAEETPVIEKTEAKPDPMAAGRLAARGFFGPLDPARLFDVLAEGIGRALQSDPDDARGNVRRKLENLKPELKDQVTANLKNRMTDSETSRLDRVLDNGKPSGQEAEEPVEARAETEEPKEEAPLEAKADEHEGEHPETQVDPKAKAKAKTKPEKDLAPDAERKRPPEAAHDAPAATEPVEAKDVPPEEEAAVAVAELETPEKANGAPIAAGGAQAGGAPGEVAEMPVAEDAPEKETSAAEAEHHEQGREEQEQAADHYHRERVEQDEAAKAEAQAEETRKEAEAQKPVVSAPTPTAAAAPAVPSGGDMELSGTGEPMIAEPEPVAEPDPGPEPHSTEVRDMEEAGYDVPTQGVAADHPNAAVADPASESPAPPPTHEGGAPVAESQTPNPDAADAGQAMAKCMGGGEKQAPPADSGGGEGGGGGACGGGGGGAPPPPEAAAAAPAGNDPAAAVAAAGSLPPDQVPEALAGAQTAASESVSTQRDELQSAPPGVDRPSGAPAGHGPVQAAGAPVNSKAAVEAVSSAGTGTKPQEAAPPTFGPPPPAPAPRFAGTAEGKASAADAQNMQAALEDLPTSDPALNTTAGEAPQLVMDGDADPQKARDQRQHLNEGAGDALADARADAATPMGENTVYPDVPEEKLEAKGSFAACVSGQGNMAPKATKPESLVAQAERPDEIATAAEGAKGQIDEGREKNQADIDAEKEKNQQEIDNAVTDSDQEQTATRNKVKKEVGEQREDWNDAQDDKVKDAKTEADKAEADGNKEVTAQQRDADRDAKSEIENGNADIKKEREKAEGDARKEKAKAKKNDSWLDRAASAIGDFFDAVKGAISAVFDAARKAVTGIIKAVQKAAMAIIDKARNAIIKAIRAVGDALIAIGDVLLAAFPGLRDKFRKLINTLVEAATDAVNAIADALKAAIQFLLDALLTAILAYLCALEAVYLAAIDVVASAVKSVIAFAKAIVAGFGAFIEIVEDVAADPGGWLSKFGSAVVSGVKNCLWSAFKTAVKNWFNQKVESILGLGRLIWNILVKGCMTLSQIGAMAWQGLKAAIPGILIGILIEKLVSMLVPVAGGLVTIIQALIAAWGTIQQIISAFQLFMTFLKAVKGGGAAGPFANAVAAAAVVVIDFVANWLIARLAMGAAKKIAAGFKAMAKKFQAMFAKLAKALKRGAKSVKSGVSKAVKKVVDTVKKIGQKIMKSKFVRRIMASKPIRAIRRAWRKAKTKFKDYRERFRQWNERRKAKAKAARLERLENAVNAGASYANRFAGKQVTSLRLRLGLVPIMARYRILSLGPVVSGSNWAIRGRVNTEKSAATSAKERTKPWPEIELLEQRLQSAEQRALADMGMQYGGDAGLVMAPGTRLSSGLLGKALDKKSGLNMTGASPAELMTAQIAAMGVPRPKMGQKIFGKIIQDVPGYGPVNVSYQGGFSGQSKNPTWATLIGGLGAYTAKGKPTRSGGTAKTFMGKIIGDMNKAGLSDAEISRAVQTGDIASVVKGKGLSKAQMDAMVPQLVRMHHLDVFEGSRSVVQAGVGGEKIPTTFQIGEGHEAKMAGKMSNLDLHHRSGRDETLTPAQNQAARDAGRHPASHTLEGASTKVGEKHELNRQFMKAWLAEWRAEEKAKLEIKLGISGVENRDAVPSVEELERRVKSHLHARQKVSV